MPVTITRPRAARMRATVAEKLAPSAPQSARYRASSPAFSVAKVRSAEAVASQGSSTVLVCSAVLMPGIRS
jgi:hypothetical protein